MLDEYVDSLAEHDLAFEYDEKVVEKLADKSIGGASGARDLRNLIRKEVEDKISELVIEKGGFDLGKLTLTADPELKILVNGKL